MATTDEGGGDAVDLSTRRGGLLAGLLAVVVVAVIVITAVAATSSNGPARVRTDAHPQNAPARTAAPTTPSVPRTTVPATTAPAPVTTPLQVPPATAPVLPPVTLSTSPPTTTPHPSPISALIWKATPTSITMRTNTKMTVTVTAHNGSKGVVTLPHPLSCAPRLQHDEICPEFVQLVGPGSTATARYTVDATGVTPGRYTLRVEGAFSIVVTVTK